VRIAFVGDICIGSAPAFRESGTLPNLHEVLGVDMVVGNFESVLDEPALADVGRPREKIRLTTSPGALNKLRKMGIDAVSVANNHMADFGPEAAARTISQLQETFGDERVFGWKGQPSTELAPGLRVLGVCFPETTPVVLDGPAGIVSADDTASGLLAKYGSASDEVVVFAHWGEEHVSLVDPLLRARSRTMFSEGAAHVVGCHGHIVAGGEDVGAATVIYGLGNFLFLTDVVRGGRRLRHERSGAVAVFSWENGRVTYEEAWKSEFDERLAVRLKRLRRRFAGGWIREIHLRLPPRVAALTYRMALSTTPFRLGLTRVLAGVERPSAKKIRTAARLLLGMRSPADARRR
jgi:hypothetical protein